MRWVKNHLDPIVWLSVFLISGFSVAIAAGAWHKTGSSEEHSRLRLCQAIEDNREILKSVIVVARDYRVAREGEVRYRVELEDMHNKLLQQVDELSCPRIASARR